VDGSPLWEHRYATSFVCGSHYTSGPYSTPASDGKRVFTLGAQGQLHCLELETGALVWGRSTSKEFEVLPDIFGAGHSPLLWQGKVILNIGGTVPDSGIVAFDQQTGEVVWSATGHGAGFATPMPATLWGTDHLFVLTRVGLVSVDPANGQVRWEIPYETRMPDAANAVTPVVHGNLVFVSVFGCGAMCLAIAEDGGYTKLWEDNRTLSSQYNPILAVDGYLYGVHSTDKSLRCVEMRTGNLQWRYKSHLYRSTQVIADGRILVFGEHGHLATLDVDPQEARVRSRTTESLFSGERCFAAPAIAEGRLYLRNEQELLCLDLRPSPAVASADAAHLAE
jgi:outer membrane protein assembly factor BamB